MADNKANVQEPEQEFNIDTKVKVKSIAGYSTSFSRIETPGDVMVMAKGVFRMTRSEIIAQVQKPNNLFTGTDGIGSHAVYYIEDAPTREYLGFDDPSEKRKQECFSDDLVKEVFEIKSQNKFEEAVSQKFITRAEKFALMDAIKRLGINDYNRIRYVEKYTGYKYDNNTQ